MSERILALLVEFVTRVISAGGYAGIAALMAINSAGIPLPSELIMPFSGYLVYLGRFNLFMVAIVGMVGCNVGSAIGYWIGFKGGQPFVERYGKWVLMSHHDLDRMGSFFQKYGSIAVLLARMLPVVQTFISIPAGIARMPRLDHVVYLPGLRGHEAWREVAHRSAHRAGLSSLSSCRGDCARGSNRLVCRFASETSETAGCSVIKSARLLARLIE
jgi:membrane protein YqaA with SNARE-associated domain